ncbi:LysR family transcriptional regulator [Vulgatibacter incomptus]|uniref:Transcriptional regulator, LysR family n=1 Tax=Vulgatibacter incomptus TaxID=1391653 RepID=A0A0K1PG02_9BACT|nr:LysR family transcriptional regulator [Vulgatibacter incomptus]AKU92463.1 transcriptional regulator, LysR family [Vulgatibacter incomptus]
MMLPDLESIRCFEAAATHLNFRKAAATVALSPTAFSDRLHGLEELLGAPLFVRTTRRVALTDAGERLLTHARRLLADAAACHAVAHDESAPPFELTIGTRFELGLSWLTPALETLRRAQPSRTIHLRFGDANDLLSQVRDGVLDACVTSSRFSGKAFRYDPLHPEQYIFVGAASALRERAFRGPADAAHHTLLDLAADLPLFRYLQDAAGPGVRWPFARNEYLGSIAAVRFRVLEGAGVAVMPRYFIQDDLERGRLRPLLPTLPLQADSFRLVWRSSHAREDDLFALSAELRAIPLR